MRNLLSCIQRNRVKWERQTDFEAGNVRMTGLWPAVLTVLASDFRKEEEPALEKEYTLIAVAGKTDPIRSLRDGPILHIVRHYHPRRVVILLSEEIGKDEEKYHHNERAVRMVDPDCDVQVRMTGIRDVHSYDDFALPLLQTCNEVKETWPEDTILLDITSGTPQLETAFCMIALSDSERYLAVQVSTPLKKGNDAPIFTPGKDSLEQWFADDEDNLPGAENRCSEPQLMNFKRPLVQSQILSLIRNFDYAGAFQLYQTNREEFSRETGWLLEHAQKRLNLQEGDARFFAGKLNREKELYPISSQKQARLVEFYNSMHVKQIRNEFNDFVLRIGIFTQELALYLLQEVMGISLDEIAVKTQRKNSDVYVMDQKRCCRRFPGIDRYMDTQFQYGFEWNREISALILVQICDFAVQQDTKGQQGLKKYRECVNEMQKWTQISVDVRNPAAHNIVAVTEEKIKNSYDGRNSQTLCSRMQRVLQIVFGSGFNKEAFDMYGKINEMIRQAMEK